MTSASELRNAQAVRMAFRTWLGETVYDATEGIPYLQVIFKQRPPNLDAIKLIFQLRALAIPGITGADLAPALDTVTRTLTITGTIDTIDGEFDFSESVTIP